MKYIPNSIKLIAVILSTTLALSSCQVGKSYIRPELNLPESLATEKDSMSLADLSWWQLYTDPMLVSLIEKSLAYNKDVLIAAARIKEMEAKKRISTAELFPQLNASASADTKATRDEDKNTSNSHSFDGALTLSWELDFWGNLRWGRKVDIAAYLQSLEAQRALELTLVSEVAQAYYELVALDAEMQILAQTLEDRKESVRLTRLRFEGGLISEIPYQQAQVEMARTATMIPAQERQIKLKENELALLVGSYPRRIEREVKLEALYQMEELPYGLPSQLLERRPDVRKAEQSLIAAHAEVGVAYTNMFPNFSLTAKVGASNSDLSSFLKTPFSLIEGAIAAPIFQAGKKRAAWKATKAAYEQELYSYEKTVLNAFIETQNAITNYDKQREVLNLKAHLERSSKKYVELARAKSLQGEILYLDLLDAQRGYLDAQIGLNNAIRDEMIAIIQLYKALGGGW